MSSVLCGSINQRNSAESAGHRRPLPEHGTVDELVSEPSVMRLPTSCSRTSNLMTRASYYLFVPWIYLRLNIRRRRHPSSQQRPNAMSCGSSNDC